MYCQPALLSAGVPLFIRLPVFWSAALQFMKSSDWVRGSWSKATSIGETPRWLCETLLWYLAIPDECLEPPKFTTAIVVTGMEYGVVKAGGTVGEYRQRQALPQETTV